jgi:hypothetical protein
MEQHISPQVETEVLAVAVEKALMVQRELETHQTNPHHKETMVERDRTAGHQIPTEVVEVEALVLVVIAAQHLETVAMDHHQTFLVLQ